MSRNNLIKKALTVAVILLFIGMGAVPSMSNGETDKTDITVKKGYDDPENTNSSSGHSFNVVSQHSFGYDRIGSAYSSISDRIKGSVFTVSEDGIAKNITAYTWCSTPIAKSKCMIYRANDSKLIGTTEELTPPYGSAEWTVYNVLDEPILEKDTKYVLASWSYRFAYLYYDNCEDEQGRRDDEEYGDPPDPADFINENRIYSIYCSYTPTPESAFVCGFVTDRDTGLPIEGVRLELWWKDDEGNYDENETYTNVSGYYSFVTKAGYVRIWAHAGGYLSEFKPQCVIEPYETLWINVSLFPIPPFTAIICGYITDKDTGDPIHQAYVYLYWRDTYGHFLSNHTYSNDSGFYQMDAPAGEINIYAVTDGHFLKQSAWYFIEESVTLWINLSLTPKPPETAVVCGYIKDKMNGEPINQVDVCLDWRDNEGHYGYNNTLTDISGFYKMHVAPGYINIDAYKLNYDPQSSQSYEVEDNQTLWINISLFPDETIHVDDDNTEGPWEGTIEYPYQYIQDGIDNASNGNTIFVYNGTYFENIIINKSIKLIGESKELTIIDGRNAEKDIITISQDFVNINNIQIKNSLINCNGIYITTSRNITIKNCVICEISGYAFELDKFHDSQIINTEIYRCGSGIHLMYSTGNNISGNFILRVFHQGIGAYAYSDNNLFSHNDIIICSQVAVVICQSENNQILNNSIIDNDGDGIIIRHNSNHNTIKYNNIAMNHDGYGIIFEKSSNNNMIVKNNFVNNKHHGSFTNSKNIWRQNYWDRSRIFPKIIFGKITIGNIEIPWVNIDWRPAKEPYEIVNHP